MLACFSSSALQTAQLFKHHQSLRFAPATRVARLIFVAGRPECSKNLAFRATRSSSVRARFGVPAYRRVTPFSSLPTLRFGQSSENAVTRRYAQGRAYAPILHRCVGTHLKQAAPSRVCWRKFASQTLGMFLHNGSPASRADPLTRVRGRNVPPASWFSPSLKFVSALRSHKLENTEIPALCGNLRSPLLARRHLKKCKLHANLICCLFRFFAPSANSLIRVSILQI